MKKYYSRWLNNYHGFTRPMGYYPGMGVGRVYPNFIFEANSLKQAEKIIREMNDRIKDIDRADINAPFLANDIRRILEGKL